MQKAQKKKHTQTRPNSHAYIYSTTIQPLSPYNLQILQQTQYKYLSLSLLSLSTYIFIASQFTNQNKLLSYKNLSIPQFTYKITLFSNPSRFLHSFSDTNPNFSLIKPRFVFLTTLDLIHRTKIPKF